MNTTEENCRELIAVYEPQPQMRNQDRMSLIGQYLISIISNCARQLEECTIHTQAELLLIPYQAYFFHEYLDGMIIHHPLIQGTLLPVSNSMVSKTDHSDMPF